MGRQGGLGRYSDSRHGSERRSVARWGRRGDPAGPHQPAFVHFLRETSVYSRKTTSSLRPGSIIACEVLAAWKERTSWKLKPVYDPEPFATYKFEPGGGWKVFDVTPLVRGQARAGRKSHGIMLRFLSEDFNERGTWSGYDFASREAGGEHADHRPMLLIVEDAKSETSPAK